MRKKCLFNEIDVNNYTVCECIEAANSKVFVEKIVFSKFSLYNIDIVTCYGNFTWQNIKNNIGFILITIFTLLAATMSYIWNCLILQRIIINNSAEQIIFNDAKYLTREIKKEKGEEKKPQKDLNEKEKEEKMFKKDDDDDEIKEKDISQNKVPKQNFSFAFSQKLKFEKKDDWSSIDNNNRNKLELQLSVDKIYELQKYQHDQDARHVNINDYLEIHGSNSKFNSVLDPEPDLDYRSINSVSILNELKLDDIQIKVPDSKQKKIPKNVKKDNRQDNSVFSYNKIEDDLEFNHKKIVEDEEKGVKDDLNEKINDKYKKRRVQLEETKQNENFRNKEEKEDILKSENRVKAGEKIISAKRKDSKNYNKSHNSYIIKVLNNLKSEKEEEKKQEDIDESLITLQDYDQMKSDHVIRYDKRGYFRILWHYLLIRHDLIATFIYSSIFVPFHIRISKFFLLINLNWCINAVLFSDDLIEQRNFETNKLLITNTFIYSLYKQLTKIIISILITKIPRILIGIFINKSEEIQNKIYDGILERDKEKIKTLREEAEKMMKTKYIIYYYFFVTFSAFCLYYSTIFCTVYRGSSINWLTDGFIGILTDYLVKIVLIVLLSLARVTVRKYKNSFWKILYWVGNKIG